MTTEQSRAAWDEIKDLHARLAGDPDRDAKIEQRMAELRAELSESDVPRYYAGKGRIVTIPED